MQQAFKIFLNVTPTVTSWSSVRKKVTFFFNLDPQASDEFSLIFETNPIAEFVELPDNYSNLKYSNILCGAIRSLYPLSLCEEEIKCLFELTFKA